MNFKASLYPDEHICGFESCMRAVPLSPLSSPLRVILFITESMSIGAFLNWRAVMPSFLPSGPQGWFAFCFPTFAENGNGNGGGGKRHSACMRAHIHPYVRLRPSVHPSRLEHSLVVAAVDFPSTTLTSPILLFYSRWVRVLLPLLRSVVEF